MTSVMLVFDCSEKTGLGHLRRMAALSAALTSMGASVTPVVTDAESFPATGVDSMDITPLALGEAIGSRESFDACVVDSYRLDVDDRRRLAPYLAIDDLVAPRNGAVLLVNPAFDVSPDAYPNLSPEQLMLGPQYALIDPNLHGDAARPTSYPPQTVFVTLGSAGDPETLEDLTERVAGETGLTPFTPGPAGSGFATGLASQIGSADIVVTAGGVTALEAASAGRPLVLLELAENQHANVDGLVAAGCGVKADLESAPSLVREVAGDEIRYLSMATAGPATVDGHGAERVARALLRETGRGSLEMRAP